MRLREIRSLLIAILFTGAALELQAQEGPPTPGCAKPAPRQNLPFPMDLTKQLCAKDLEIKKEGWYPTGLPLINSDPNEGIGYGVRAYAYNNGKKSDPLFDYTPYRLRFFAQYFNTNKNAQYHQLSLDMPFIANTQWRLRADAFLTITPTTLYFGIGQSSLQTLSYQDRNQPGGQLYTNSTYQSQQDSFTYRRPGGPQDPVYFGGNTYTGLPSQPGFQVTDKMYNRYQIETPMLNLSTERSFFGGTVRLVTGIKASNNIINTFDGKLAHSYDPVLGPNYNAADVPNGKTRLTQDQEAGKILGFHGGYVNSIRLGLVYDTRDFEPDPNSGVFLEATYEKNSKSLGSDFNFEKYFAQGKFFWSPFPKTFDKLVLASRFGMGLSDGDVPFFEYRNMWGTEGLIGGLGGLRTIRGYKQDRFVGRMMGWGNIELRWKFGHAQIGTEYFAFNLVPFFDFGRVWDDEHKIGTQGYKYSKGIGLRIAWNQATIIMIDYAKSREDEQLFVNFSHAF